MTAGCSRLSHPGVICDHVPKTQVCDEPSPQIWFWLQQSSLRAVLALMLQPFLQARKDADSVLAFAQPAA